MMGVYHHLRLVLACSAALCGLMGCQSYWDADPQLGSSVNGAIRAQVANPNAPQVKPTAKQGMDGVAAKKTVDNYQQSFDAKSVITTAPSLVNINNATAGNLP